MGVDINVYQLTSKAKPNRTHHLIHECLLSLAKKGKKPVLVTQNIDNLHILPQNGEYEFHPVHGNLALMRCSNMHFLPYSKEKINSTCEVCS